MTNTYACQCGQKFEHPVNAMTHIGKCDGPLFVYGPAGIPKSVTDGPALKHKPGEIVVVEGATIYMAPNGDIGFPYDAPPPPPSK